MFEKNRGRVPEINPGLLPRLIAGVKDLHQIALWFNKQESPDARILPSPALCQVFFFLLLVDLSLKIKLENLNIFKTEE